MAFADNPLWEDSLTYSGLVIRRQDAMMLQSDGTAGGAVPGIRAGDIGLAVSLAGSTITVTAGVAALYKSGFGVYRVSNPSSWTGTLTAANATNPRIDLVYVRVWDNAEDSSGLFKADVVYLAGTAAPSPVAPSPGGTEIYIPLATISVPQVGGGSASVSTAVRAITVAPGGISPNAAQAGTYAGQYRDGGTLQRYNGSTWEDKLYLAAGGQVNVGASGSGGSFAAQLSATSGIAASARVTGDTSNRFTLNADGKHQWGSGSASSDTNLYRTGVGQLTTDGSLVVGTALTVLGVGQQLTVIKTGDTARTSNITVANDPDLTINLAANATYLIDGYWLITGGTTGSSDFKAAMVYSGTLATGSNWWTPYGPTTTSSTATFQNGLLFNAAAVAALGTYSTSTPVNAAPRGTIVTTGVGILALQWAQNTSSGTATTLKAGSWLRVTRVA